jgi:hypothetical protein
MANKKQRVSRTVHICKHGTFKGCQWSGHRRTCKAKEIITKGKSGTLMGRTIKTLQRAHAAKFPVRADAVRVEENTEIPMADSVTLRKDTGSETEKLLLEIGIKQIKFWRVVKTDYLAAKIVETIKDHPSLLPYVAGDEIRAMNDMPFTTEHHFFSLLKGGIEENAPSIWITLQRGDSAPIRRTVTLRSALTYPMTRPTPEEEEKRFREACDILGFEDALFLPHAAKCARPCVLVERISPDAPSPLKELRNTIVPMYVISVNNCNVSKSVFSNQVTQSLREELTLKLTVMDHMGTEHKLEINGEEPKSNERFDRACQLLGFPEAAFSERFVECMKPAIRVSQISRKSPFFEPIRSMILMMSSLPVYIIEVNGVPVRKETLADQIEISRGKIGRMMSLTIQTRGSERKVVEGCLNDVPANVEPAPQVEKKTIFVPSSDIIMKVEARLKSLDAKIANTKAEAKMHTEASLRLAKELREARDFALASDKQVGELEGQRKEFLKKLAAFAK